MKKKTIKAKTMQKYLDAWLEAQKPMFQDLAEIDALIGRFQLMWGIVLDVRILKTVEEKKGRGLQIGAIEDLQILANQDNHA
jgi:hypothetical protein